MAKTEEEQRKILSHNDDIVDAEGFMNEFSADFRHDLFELYDRLLEHFAPGVEPDIANYRPLFRMIGGAGLMMDK